MRSATRIACIFALTSAARAFALPADFVDTPVVTGLNQPLALAFMPDGRMLVAERAGAVLGFAPGSAVPDTVLQLELETYSEQGLLGMALDPLYPDSAYLYLVYTVYQGTPTENFNRLSRFTLTGNVADPGSELVLLSGIPTGRAFHVAGCVRFAPDGHLFVSVGDGGWQTSTYPQDLSRLEGKLLRLERDGSIPLDNPFADSTGARPEIWQFGMRNPFRFVFQPATGMAFISDPGTNKWEEIDVGAPGANFGWPLVEGPVASPPAGVTQPWYAYRDSAFAAITGAAFYTGTAFPLEYKDNLFYLDHPRGTLGRIVLDAGGAPSLVEPRWAETPASSAYPGPVDLEVGPDGALYYTTYYTSQVRRIEYVRPLAALALPQAPVSLAAGPNPFRASTRLRFTLPRDARARIAVHDPAGRRVRVLANGPLTAGTHEIEWNGRGDTGRRVPPGVYWVLLLTGDQEVRCRVIVLD